MPAKTKYDQAILFDLAVTWMEAHQQPLTTASWNMATPPPFPRSAINNHFGSLPKLWEKLVSRGKMTEAEVHALRQARYRRTAESRRRRGGMPGWQERKAQGIPLRMNLANMVDF